MSAEIERRLARVERELAELRRSVVESTLGHRELAQILRDLARGLARADGPEPGARQILLQLAGALDGP